MCQSLLKVLAYDFSFKLTGALCDCLSTKSRKEFLVLTCGPASLSSATPRSKGEDGESCSDEDSSGDEENQISVSDRHRPRKKQKLNKQFKGKEWVMRKKDKMRRKGNAVPADSKYTARKRKTRF